MYHGGEGAKALAELHLHVHHSLHIAAAGIAEDTAAAQGPRTKLHAALKPPDDFACCDFVRNPVTQGVIAANELIGGSGGPQE